MVLLYVPTEPSVAGLAALSLRVELAMVSAVRRGVRQRGRCELPSILSSSKVFILTPNKIGVPSAEVAHYIARTSTRANLFLHRHYNFVNVHLQYFADSFDRLSHAGRVRREDRKPARRPGRDDMTEGGGAVFKGHAHSAGAPCPNQASCCLITGSDPLWTGTFDRYSENANRHLRLRTYLL